MAWWSAIPDGNWLKNASVPRNAWLMTSAIIDDSITVKIASMENSRQDQLDSEEDSGDRGVERRCDAAGGAAGHQDS